jgi:hypothetical protein
MSDSYSSWSEVKARGRAADLRAEDEKAAGKAAARERREAYVRGHQLADAYHRRAHPGGPSQSTRRIPGPHLQD